MKTSLHLQSIHHKKINLNRYLTLLAVFFAFLIGNTLCAQNNSVILDTKWIPSKPEVLTYRTISAGDTGLYQLTILKGDSTIETYINIISPGYTKSVSGFMTTEMIPLRSTGKIFVNNQIQMDTEITYDAENLNVTTVMIPFNRTVKKVIPYTGRVVDPAQVPFISRVLPLKKDAAFEFPSLNPQNNTLVPFSVKVVGEETVMNIECYKVEIKHFEGEAMHWVEKASPHRLVRTEQPSQHRITELIQ